ncbi:MAG: META domain-containing protein [Alphaproteobacteria bacterium]|nr:META domain-containing protein [Alphaproteobacteria bacterium]
MSLFLRSSGLGSLSAAVFLLAQSLAAVAAPVQGPEWVFANDPPEAQRSVQFSGGGRLIGFSGCNPFSGPYELTQDGLTIGEVVATRRDCSQEAMDRETELFRILNLVRSAEASQSELVLKAADGTPLANLARRSQR